jgi:prolyl-tRNA editing enzyme YbaK/EbsC (Cys-tRNA(Pro) deacylase)
MSVPAWIASSLDDRAVQYRQQHHRTAYTAQGVASHEHIAGSRFGKVVVAMADDRPVLLVMPAHARVDPIRACAALSAHDFRLAEEDEIARLIPDADVGTIPPLRHWPGVDIWMDPSLKHEGEFAFQAGTHEDTIHMDFADWLRITQPQIGSFVRG